MTDPLAAVEQAVQQGQAAAIAEANAEEERLRLVEEAHLHASIAGEQADTAHDRVSDLERQLAEEREANATWRNQSAAELEALRQEQANGLSSVSAQLTELSSRLNPPAEETPPAAQAVVAVEAAVPPPEEGQDSDALNLNPLQNSKGGHRRRILGRR